MRTLSNVLSLLIAVCAMVLASCSPEDPFVPTIKPVTTLKAPAYLRVVHAKAGTPGAQVFVGDSLFFTRPVEYLSFSSEPGANGARYYPADTSAHVISFRWSGGRVDSAITMQDGKYYTAYLYGDGNSAQILITSDEPTPTPGTSYTKYRIVQLAPDAGAVDVKLNESGPIVVNDLKFGQASPYQLTPLSAATSGLQPFVYDSTGAAVFGMPYSVPSPSDVVITILLAGKVRPRENEPMLFLALFPADSYQDPTSKLYGNAPYRVSVAGLRFMNLVPTGGPLLGLTFYRNNNPDWAANQHFHRDFYAQGLVLAVPPLGILNPGLPGKYMPLSLVNPNYPYRIEIHPPGFFDRGEALVPGSNDAPGIPFVAQADMRYTVVAYGPFSKDSARSTRINDNVAYPASNGSITARLFHGAFGPLENTRLRLKIGGITSPRAIGYGEAPTSADLFEAPFGGAITLVDDAGTEIPVTIADAAHYKLEAGAPHTFFLSRGYDGKTLLLTPVPDTR